VRIMASARTRKDDPPHLFDEPVGSFEEIACEVIPGHATAAAVIVDGGVIAWDVIRHRVEARVQEGWDHVHVVAPDPHPSDTVLRVCVGAHGTYLRGFITIQ
jgi:hypothetical protein